MLKPSKPAMAPRPQSQPKPQPQPQSRTQPKSQPHSQPAPAVAPSQGVDSEDDYAPMRTHRPQPQQQPKQPKSQQVAAAATGGTGESQQFCESDESDESEAAVAEPLSMSPISTYSFSRNGEEDCGSPYEETREHPKHMDDYLKEAREQLCDDEHDSMTRASSIADRKWHRHQNSKRQKVTSDTQRDSVPEELSLIHI